MYQILFCSDPGIVRALYLVKVILNMIRFTLPIGLIFMVSIDIYKNLIIGSPDNKQTVIKKSGDRIIACVVVFLIPTLINLLLAFISKIGFDTDNTSFVTCYTEASKELIETLEEQKSLKLKEKEEEKRKANAILVAQVKAKQKAQIEANKLASGNNNSEYSNNLTDLKKQNGVYIKDGAFYVPKFKKNDPSTFSGKECPKNPLNEGYNNKYGFNNYFWTMLSNLIKGAEEAGYKLRFYTDGCRSYDTQYYYYHKKYKNEPGRAAVPGNSRHGWGIAADLIFYKNLSKKCGTNRTYSNCPGMKWVHDHAGDYGLKFPLLKASYREDWHIEPANLVRF